MDVNEGQEGVKWVIIHWWSVRALHNIIINLRADYITDLGLTSFQTEQDLEL